MGRKKIEIEKINDPKRRIVTFSKRRKGLASKLAQLCERSDVENAALITFSPAGKVFSYSYGSSSSIDNTIERFLIGNKNQSKKKQFVDSVEELDTVEKLMAKKKFLMNLKQKMLERMEELKISSSSSSYSQKNDEQEVKIESLAEDERIVAETLSIWPWISTDFDNVEKMQNDEPQVIKSLKEDVDFESGW
ncbi:hypothetical protein MKX03_023988 [Papaver bracteatum]|nr:hypothetical protein MKX03_023988 [Papaver bracteatum]